MYKICKLCVEWLYIIIYYELLCICTYTVSHTWYHVRNVIYRCQSLKEIVTFAINLFKILKVLLTRNDTLDHCHHSRLVVRPAQVRMPSLDFLTALIVGSWTRGTRAAAATAAKATRTGSSPCRQGRCSSSSQTAHGTNSGAGANERARNRPIRRLMKENNWGSAETAPTMDRPPFVCPEHGPG